MNSPTPVYLCCLMFGLVLLVISPPRTSVASNAREQVGANDWSTSGISLGSSESLTLDEIDPSSFSTSGEGTQFELSSSASKKVIAAHRDNEIVVPPNLTCRCTAMLEVVDAWEALTILQPRGIVLSTNWKNFVQEPNLSRILGWDWLGSLELVGGERADSMSSSLLVSMVADSGLKSLRLNGVSLHADDESEVVESIHLEKLAVIRCGGSRSFFEAFAEAPALKTFEYDGWLLRGLKLQKAFPALRELRFGEGFQVFSGFYEKDSVASPNMRRNGKAVVTKAGPNYIEEAEQLTELESLVIRNASAASDAHMAFLNSLENLKSLHIEGVGRSKIFTGAWLADVEHPERFESLSVVDCTSVTSNALHSLSRVRGLKKLRVGRTEWKTREIAQAVGQLKNLESLELSRTLGWGRATTDQLTLLTRLQYLNLDDSVLLGADALAFTENTINLETVSFENVRDSAGLDLGYLLELPNLSVAYLGGDWIHGGVLLDALAIPGLERLVVTTPTTINCSALGMALEQSRLLSLTIRDATFDGAGLRLTEHCSLERLFLWNVTINDQLFDSSSDAPHLESLTLRYLRMTVTQNQLDVIAAFEALNELVIDGCAYVYDDDVRFLLGMPPATLTLLEVSFPGASPRAHTQQKLEAHFAGASLYFDSSRYQVDPLDLFKTEYRSSYKPQ